MKIARTKLVMYYLETKGNKKNTMSDIFKAQDEACKFYDLLVDQEKKSEILKEYGYTNETWEEVLYNAQLFWFTPDQRQERCNKAIRDFINQKPNMNGCFYSYNQFSGQLCNWVKKGDVKRENHLYWLSDKEFDRIKELMK